MIERHTLRHLVFGRSAQGFDRHGGASRRPQACWQRAVADKSVDVGH